MTEPTVVIYTSRMCTKASTEFTSNTHLLARWYELRSH